MSKKLAIGVFAASIGLALATQGCMSEAGPEVRETGQLMRLGNETFQVKPVDSRYRYLRTLTAEDFRKAADVRKAREVQEVSVPLEVADAGMVAFDKMSREELANAYRDVVLMPDGSEYEEMEPRWDIADLILAQRSKVKPDPLSPPPEGDHTLGAPAPEKLEGHNIFGADTRVRVRNNGSHPFKAIGRRDQFGCTHTLIGPSTALSAAHCYMTGSALDPITPIRFGLDSADNPDTTAPAEPCYARHVPIEYRNGNTDANFDFVVIDFDACGRAPGNRQGWMGLWAAQDGHFPSFGSVFAYGYPANSDGNNQSCPSGTSPATCYSPTIWGTSSNWYGVRSSLQIKHKIDTTGGQSGALVYVFDGDDRYAIGIHKGYTFDLFQGGTFNYGRRVDSTLFAYIESHSDWNRDASSVKHPRL